jgi:hypothetical protein
MSLGPPMPISSKPSLAWIQFILAKRSAHFVTLFATNAGPERESRGHFQGAIRRRNPQTKKVIFVYQKGHFTSCMSALNFCTRQGFCTGYLIHRKDLRQREELNYHS